MNRLYELLGKEHHLDFVNRALRDFARDQRAAEIGAMHVTCSDECERETVESFQHWFADPLLPELKFSSKAPFRSANLGGRYEWGSMRIAEHHFATPPTRDSFKLLLIKINAHVSVVGDGDHAVFGLMPRYDTDSVFCGAVHAMLNGDRSPAISELHEVMASEGKDRVAILQDGQQVEARLRPLLAAVVSARLQARRAILDIQDYRPATPTLYTVVPSVTINRKQRDTEFLVGVYQADSRDSRVEATYRGLGDDPSSYQITLRHSALQITDDHIDTPREARDHRQLIHGQIQLPDRDLLSNDQRIQRVASQA